MTNHRTSSIQRPITGEVTRPTRRRRRPAADGTPGRGLPERPLPGRPGNVLRAPTVAAARPSALRRAPARQPSTTVGRAAPSARRDAGPATQAMPLTAPLARKATTDRRGGKRNRGSSRPAGQPRRDPHQRPLAVIPGQPEGSSPARPSTPRRRPDAPKVDASARRRRAPAARSAKRDTVAASADDAGRKRRRKQPDAPADAGTRSPRKRRPTVARDAPAQPRTSALRDVTRPIARDSRMAERRPVRIGYGLIAAAIGLALVAALVVLPVRRWWNQREDLADRRSELEILREANGRLGNEVAALNTPEGIEAAARTDLNFGYPGEDRTRSVGDPQAPIVLPPGFPYNVVTNLLAARTNLAATSPNPVATVAPGAPTASVDPATGASADTTVPASTEPPEPTIAPPAGAFTPSAP